MNKSKASTWPTLKTYDQQHLLKIALPLGGIGTGTVSLGGRGNLKDWEIVNRPAKGFTPQNAFFSLYIKEEGKAAIARALEGSIDPSQYEGARGCMVPNHNLPRFRNCHFEAAYPLGQVFLDDPEMPVKVCLQAFNPLFPPDTDLSGIPVAVLRYQVTNLSNAKLEGSICGSLENFIGADGSDPRLYDGYVYRFDHKFNQNVNEYRSSQEVSGIFMSSDGLDPEDEAFGTIALTTLTAPLRKQPTVQAHTVSYRTAWAKLTWGDSLLDFWDDFSQDGVLEERESGGVNDPTGSLAVKFELEPHATQEVTFLLTWHFPNRQTWTPSPENAAKAEGLCEADICSPSEKQKDEDSCCEDCDGDCHCGSCECDGECEGDCDCDCEEGECCCCECDSDPDTIGNYYTCQYLDAWDVARQVAGSLPELEAQTLEFVNTFLSSDLPDVVKEAALFNMSSLRTQTCFRTPDGRFFGWEGCDDTHGCCHGCCTHVWNYEQVTAYLFGSLSRSLRRTEFLSSTDERGLMSFRTNLPLDRANEWGKAAADGQMGCLMKLYRDWKLSGNDHMLHDIWPSAKKVMEFCWIPNGWDADQDGVMEGCQHNTMDVEYYGPNPQMGIWYLGALRAMEEMARYLGETAFSDKCHTLFANGSQWIDAHLFNGDYYEHEIRPPKDENSIAPGLRWNMGALNLAEPDLQLGSGCLIDQLVGQYMAHICGLGYLVEKDHILKTLKSLMKYNFRTDFYGHFNHLRTFVMNEEAAMVMASYPKGRRPKRPFPYFNEVMTGFEYTAAVHMLYEGDTEDGLKVISAIRERYDGHKRSPFDEAECGHHYARAMSSWAAVLALSGFYYSGVEQTMTFAPKKAASQTFWSTGDAWGSFTQKPNDQAIDVEIKVMNGDVMLSKLELTNFGSTTLDQPALMSRGDTLQLTVSPTR